MYLDQTYGPLRLDEISAWREHFQHWPRQFPIIGSGGVMNVSDVRAKLDAGATLVQVYTGLVYNGPGFVKKILMDIREY